jgi:hypothetical protein
VTGDLIVVVPGIMGSVLKRGAVTVWDTNIATATKDLLRFGQLTDALRLPPDLGDAEPDQHHALQATDLIGGWHLWPGVWTGAGYHGLVTDLRSWYPEPRQVVKFPYDWRLSNRVTATRLGRFVKDALASWRKASGNSDALVVFVCHSMGGLVARHYVNTPEGEGVCRRIITIGTPYTGSVKAVRALAGDIPLCPDRLTLTMRSMPSLHQLLPSFRCVRTASGMVGLADAPLPGIDTSMAADALDLHERSVGRKGNPPTHAFAGRFHTTLAGVEVVRGRLRYHTTWLESGPSGLVERDHGGDGTVPTFAATPTELAEDTATEFHSARHGLLPKRQRLLVSLRRKIENLAPAAFLDDDLEFGLDLPDVASAAEPVPVRVNRQGADLNFLAAAADLHGKYLFRGLSLNPDSDGDGGGYAAALPLPAGIWHVEVTLAGQPPGSGAADLVLVG